MGLLDEVRSTCREIAETARYVSIDLDAARPPAEAHPPALDPEAHYLEGSPGEVATYLLTLDAINFGSGWFPTLRKRPGRSGYFTVAWALADRFRAHGPWSERGAARPRSGRAGRVLGQEPGHALMRALRPGPPRPRPLPRRPHRARPDRRGGRLGRAARRPLARGMRFFDDRGFYKRAQIAPSDLALAGLASFHDLDRLTIFADNLVPHVLRVDGVLATTPISRPTSTPSGSCRRVREELEIRACALYACEQLAERTGVAAARARPPVLEPRAGAGVQGRTPAPHPLCLSTEAAYRRASTAVSGLSENSPSTPSS